MAVTLEKLLTHPRAFGLTTASPVQRACCRVADGLPLGELAGDPDVVEAMGGAESLALLPRRPPKELYLVAAIRGGKSLFAAALGFCRAMTVDLGFLGPQEVPRVSVVSVDRDKATIVKQHLMGALTREGSLLRRFLVHETAERVLLRREDGRLVEVVIAAGRVGGASLVSRWTIAAIFDEAARMLGKQDGAINFDDMRKGVIARLGLLPGAQLAVVTSPWAARGPVFDATEKHHGKPSEQLVVIRASGPMINPTIWTPEACEAERLRPDGAYETDVLGLFVDAESGYLTAAQVAAATRTAPTELPREEGVEYTAAMDPAVSSNAWTLVIVGRWPGVDGNEAEDVFKVALAHQWQGTPNQPLRAREVFAEMAPMLAKYGISTVGSDRWAGALITEHGETAGITVDVAKETPEEQAKSAADFRTRVLDGRIELAPVPALRADLLGMRKKLMPGGRVKYEPTHTHDGRHGDFGPAVILAVSRASSSPSWVFAMHREAERRKAAGDEGEGGRVLRFPLR